MTRELRLEIHGRPLPGWTMYCNGCGAHGDVRPTMADLPLAEFVAAGWFVGYTVDRCPVCVAAAGGLAAVARELRASPTMGRYVPAEEAGGWHCLTCDDDVRAHGFTRGSFAVVDDQDQHNRWHEQVEAQQVEAQRVAAELAAGPGAA